MAKQRFVLRFGGDGAKPPADAERIRNLPDADVVDESARMMLVASDEDSLRDLVESLPGWAIAAEQTMGVPDTRNTSKALADAVLAYLRSVRVPIIRGPHRAVASPGVGSPR